MPSMFNAELYDTASAFNTSTYTFTVPSGQGGKYVLNCGIRRNNWTSDRFYTILKKGSAAMVGRSPSRAAQSA